MSQIRYKSGHKSLSVLCNTRYTQWLPLLVAGIAVMVFSTSCTKSDEQAQVGEDTATSAVATIYPLYCLAEMVAGDDINVTLLLPPGVSPHGYEITPANVVAVKKSNIIIKAGGGVDSWIDPLSKTDSDDSQATIDFYNLVVDSSLHHDSEDDNHSSNDPEHGDSDHSDDEIEHGAQHGHQHGHAGLNPHQWLIPRHAITFVEHFAEALIEQMPEKSDAITARMENAVSQLQDLDKEYRQVLGAAKDRRIIIFHDAFAPLADEYHLDVVGVIYSMESHQVTPGSLSRVLFQIKSEEVRAVFTEPQILADAMSQIDDLVTIRVLDPLGNPQKQGFETYISTMRSNLDTLKQGLADNTKSTSDG